MEKKKPLGKLSIKCPTFLFPNEKVSTIPQKSPFLAPRRLNKLHNLQALFFSSSSFFAVFCSLLSFLVKHFLQNSSLKEEITQVLSKEKNRRVLLNLIHK